eukprot:1119779-Prymnesium_polylepis.1
MRPTRDARAATRKSLTCGGVASTRAVDVWELECSLSGGISAAASAALRASPWPRPSRAERPGRSRNHDLRPSHTSAKFGPRVLACWCEGVCVPTSRRTIRYAPRSIPRRRRAAARLTERPDAWRPRLGRHAARRPRHVRVQHVRCARRRVVSRVGLLDGLPSRSTINDQSSKTMAWRVGVAVRTRGSSRISAPGVKLPISAALSHYCYT